MGWKIKLAALLIIAIPSFTGFPLKHIDAEVVPGLSWSWVFYLFGIHLVLRVILGRYRYGKIIGIAALITLPVVYSGAAISFLLWIVKQGGQAEAFAFGSHYINLNVTMLTVIPLALSIVILMPFNLIEQRLLQGTTGVTAMEKRLLIAIRVFNHIVFEVLPTILEVLREESYLNRSPDDSRIEVDKFSLQKIRRELKRINSKMVQIGVEGICAAIQYIPLWAVEISQLPEGNRATKNNRS